MKQNQDDIFVDGDEYYGMAEGDNLLDDLLNDPIVPHSLCRSKRRRRTSRDKNHPLNISLCL